VASAEAAGLGSAGAGAVDVGGREVAGSGGVAAVALGEGGAGCSIARLRPIESKAIAASASTTIAPSFAAMGRRWMRSTSDGGLRGAPAELSACSSVSPAVSSFRLRSSAEVAGTGLEGRSTGRLGKPRAWA